jgi:hypothetical protein
MATPGTAPTYRALRGQAPSTSTRHGTSRPVMRYDDTRTVLKDTVVFSNQDCVELDGTNNEFFRASDILLPATVCPKRSRRSTRLTCAGSASAGTAARSSRSSGSATRWPDEFGGFGVPVAIVEPGAFRTDFDRSVAQARQLATHDDMLATERAVAAGNGNGLATVGDRHGAAAPVLVALDSAAPPLRLPLGAMATDLAQLVGRRLDEISVWKEIGRAADPPVDRDMEDAR